MAHVHKVRDNIDMFVATAFIRLQPQLRRARRAGIGARLAELGAVEGYHELLGLCIVPAWWAWRLRVIDG